MVLLRSMFFFPSNLLLFFGCIVGSSYAQLPSYIKPCSKSDPNKKECFTARANELIPHIIKGDKSLNLPNLSPMKLRKVETSAGSLKLTFQDVDVYGLETTKMVNMDADFDKNKFILAMDLSTVSLVGNYEIDGQIMILPVKGNGPFNITMDTMHLKYTVNYKSEMRNGKHYSTIGDYDNFDWTVKKTYFKFDNLFNGNKQMGDNVNKFLNENDQDVIKEVADAVSGIIKVVTNTVFDGVLGSVSFEDLYLA